MLKPGGILIWFVLGYTGSRIIVIAMLLKVPMTDFFIFLLDFTSGSDVKSTQFFPIAIFLHRILAVLKTRNLTSG